MNLKKVIPTALIVILIGLQFFHIDKENPPITEANTLEATLDPPSEVTQLLELACYDCHSDKTKYPWYTSISPLNWWIKDHIDHGKEHLNFSRFGEYPPKRARHKLEECFEMVENGEMPLDSYTWAHSEARLSQEQRDMLFNYFKSEYEKYPVPAE